MSDTIKEAFQQVRAQEALKDRTKAFLAQKTQEYTQPARPARRLLGVYAAACACLLFLVAGGIWFYFAPTVEISIDINPSIELCVNRFDQVVSVNSYNQDGRDLSNSLDIKFKNYADAVEQIMNHEQVAALLSRDALMIITVIGPDGAQASKIFSDMEACAAQRKNTHCHSAQPEEAALAHQLGLSCGKYRAFLEVQKLDPSVSPETVQNMTMREIRELIIQLGGSSESFTATYGHGNKSQDRDSCPNPGQCQKHGQEEALSPNSSLAQNQSQKHQGAGHGQGKGQGKHQGRQTH